MSEEYTGAEAPTYPWGRGEIPPDALASPPDLPRFGVVPPGAGRPLTQSRASRDPSVLQSVMMLLCSTSNVQLVRLSWVTSKIKQKTAGMALGWGARPLSPQSFSIGTLLQISYLHTDRFCLCRGVLVSVKFVSCIISRVVHLCGASARRTLTWIRNGTSCRSSWH
jgi:hypothetical protein